MAEQLEWILIGGPETGRLGAVGFLGDTMSAIALFDAEADAAQVISAARTRPEVFSRDPGIAQLISRSGSEFPRALPLDTAWSNYFRPGVSMTTRGADRIVHGASVARILPRRGEEQALDQAVSA